MPARGVTWGTERIGAVVSEIDRDSADPPLGQEPEGGSDEPTFRRWFFALRNALGTGLGSILLTLPLKFCGFVPEIVVVRLFAIVSLLAAITYAVRWDMHLQILRYYGSKSRAHTPVVALEGIVMVAFFAFGPYCLFWPNGLLQFFIAIGLLTAIFALGLAMAWLSRKRGVKTGTEEAEHCGLIRFLRYDILEPVDYVRPFKWLYERWELVAPKGRMSYMSVWLCAVLISVASANSPRVAPAAYHLLKGSKQATVDGSRRRTGQSEVASEPDTTEQRPVVEVEEPVVSADPSYEDLCPSGPVPGEPAPEPQRNALYRRWLDGGLGAAFAGCARPARRLPDEAWYAPGYCGASIRSLAIGTPEGGGEMVLWDPAAFALTRAREGALTGLISNQPVEEGEIAGVETRGGTFLFMRARISGNEFSWSAQRCQDIHRGAPFITLPPALSRLWSREVAREYLWIWPLREEVVSSGGKRFTFEDPSFGTREIVGYCRSDFDCELRVEGVISRSSGPGVIDIDRVLAST